MERQLRASAHKASYHGTSTVDARPFTASTSKKPLTDDLCDAKELYGRTFDAEVYGGRATILKNSDVDVFGERQLCSDSSETYASCRSDQLFLVCAPFD